MAYSFVRASTQYLQGSFNLTAYPSTIAFWGYALVNNLALGALSCSDDASGLEGFRGLFAGNIANDPVNFACRDNGVNSNVSSATGFTVNTWHHACGVNYSSTSRKVYLDGVEGGESTVDLNPTDLTLITIGGVVSNNTVVAHFDGNISELAVWSAALTDDEIKSLSKGFSPKKIRPQSLEFYSPLIRNIVDYTGPVSLTNYNSATPTEHNRIYS